MELTFVDEIPVSKHDLRAFYKEVRAALKEQPGKWAMIKETDDQRIAATVRVTIAASRGGEFSAKVRKNDDGLLCVWASYQPKGQQ